MPEQLAAMDSLFGYGTSRVRGDVFEVLDQCHVSMAVFRHLDQRARPTVQACECHMGYLRIGPCIPLPVIVDLEYLQRAIELFRALGARSAYLRIGQPFRPDPNWRATVLEVVAADGQCDGGRLLIAGIQASEYEVENWQNECDGVLPEWVGDLRARDWFERMDQA